jgi:hypothetical protein
MAEPCERTPSNRRRNANESLVEKSNRLNELSGAESLSRSQEYAQLVQKFPAFYGTRRFITVFTTARHMSLSRAK